MKAEHILINQFEINMETGEIRSKIFYCNPQQSSQKSYVENNHNFIRKILPNGQSWYNLIFAFIYEKPLADKLNIHNNQKHLHNCIFLN